MIAVVAGAAASLGPLFYVGRRTPRFLLVLFVGWVLAPFAALVLADVLSRRWSVAARTTLHVVTLILPIGSFVSYLSVALKPPAAQRAPMFVLMPIVSWIVMLTVIPIAAFVSGRMSPRRK